MRIKAADWLLATGLFAATLCAYQPAWQGKPLLDDEEHLTRPGLRSLEGLGSIWTQPGATQQYYPVTFTTFWVQHRLWGDSTLGHHLVNICLHCISTLLFLAILRRLELPGGWLAAGIFALHPVHVESVAWMTQLKNTLSGVFCLSALLAYLHFDRTRSKMAFVTALGLFVVGLLAKTAIVALPAGLLVVLWWKRGKLSWKGDVLPMVPFFTAGLAAGLFTVLVESRLFGAHGAEFRLTFAERCLVAGRAVWFHLSKLCWPADLRFMYPRWAVEQARWREWLLYPGGLGLVLAGLWRLRRWRRGPLAAMLLFVGTLFPTLGFFNAYTFRYCFVNNHYQYLASLSIIALFSAGATLWWGRWFSSWRTLGTALCLVLFATLATLSWRQCRMYSDAETLWRKTLACTPECWLGHNNLGLCLLEQKKMPEAVTHFQRALELHPSFAEAHCNLGITLFRQGRIDEAIAQFREALQLAPHMVSAFNNLAVALMQKGQVTEAIVQLQRAVAVRPDQPDTRDNLGKALQQSGQLSEAIVQFRKALEIQPAFSKARKDLAEALLEQGQLDEAIDQFTEVLRGNPNDPAPHCRLAELLSAQGNTSESIRHYQAALQVLPDFPEALNNLAWIRAANPIPEVRSGAEAVSLAERACQLTGYTQPVMVGTLAAAYAEAGRFAEAVATAQKATALAEQSKQPELAARNRKLLELYRAGRPARDGP